MKKAVITGGTGFIGANLARRLLEDGHRVYLMVRRDCRPWRIESIRDQLCLREVDLADAEGLRRAIGEIRPDWVFHLAAYGAYSYQTDPHQMVQTNILGAVNLLEACIRTGFEAFVNTGSSSEYGFKDHAPSEAEALEPNSYYAVTKASATLACSFLARKHGVHLPTLRLYSVYGPYEEPTRLIPALVVNGLRGELPPLVNPGIARDYVFVDDVVEAYLAAAGHPGQEPGPVYNIGTGVQTTLQEAVETAKKVLNIGAEPRWGAMSDRHWDTSIWVADSRKIEDRLGWRHRFNFEQGFRLTVRWFHDNPGMLDFYLDHSG